MIQQELYTEAVRRCKIFLKHNKLSVPRFVTYEECELRHKQAAQGSDAVYKDALHDVRLTRRLEGGATVGMASGFYHLHPTHGPTCYVNLAKTALPVLKPAVRSWSYPAWKTDRTAMGVVAHEVGHHVVEEVSKRFTQEPRKKVTKEWSAELVLAELREKWATVIKGRQVSGYEPTPGEAAAETLRLFILNPSLLQEALPKRWSFLTEELRLKPSELRHWRKVLKGASAAYLEAGRGGRGDEGRC